MNKKNVAGLIILILFYFAACGAENCDSEMAGIREELGAPEETTSFQDDTYHSIEWWYWTRGVEYTFSWGGEQGSCHMTKYTFDPIPANSPASAKARAIASARIAARSVSFDR